MRETLKDATLPPSNSQCLCLTSSQAQIGVLVIFSRCFVCSSSTLAECYRDIALVVIHCLTRQAIIIIILGQM